MEVLNIPAILASASATADATATQGYATAATAASPFVAAAPLVCVLSPLNLMHLRFICRVDTYAKIP